MPSVSIDGPGRGELVAQRGGFELQLQGTSELTVVALINPNDDQVALTGITTNSAVGTLDLGNADLSGKVIFQFPVGSLVLGQVSHTAIVSSASNAFRFRANAVSDASVVAPNASVSVDVASWSSSAAGSSRLGAARLTSLITTGNFGADLSLSSTAGGFTLGRVQIGGAITGGVWSVHGNADRISATSTAAAWRMNISGTLNQLSTTKDASGNVAVAELQLLQLGGDARGLKLLVGADLGDDAALGGSGTAADRFRPGTLARVRIDGDMIDSSLYSSVDPVNGVLNDGDDIQLGTAAQRLQEFVLGGQPLGTSSVVAPAFPASVRIGGVDLDPATLPQFFRNVPGGGDTGDDTTAPSISATLLHDTGLSADDGITNDPSIAGTATDNVAVTQLLAALDPDAQPNFINITTQLQPNGSFTLTRSVLDTLAGGTLADGQHTLRLIASDVAGNVSSPLDLSFTLDTVAPTGARFGISLVDALNGDDTQTTSAIVTLQGTAEAAATITLTGQNLLSTAGGNGNFQLPGVA
jgi:hypothetical protein